MEVLHNNYSIINYNTFKVDVSAKYFYEFSELDEIKSFLSHFEYQKYERLIIGGGSNLLFTKDFEGVVIHPLVKGIEIIKYSDDKVYLKAGAGVNWDDFVSFCVTNNLGGVENLSYIPGTVGASAVQNIGAYGVEAKDTILEVEALNINTLELKTFTNKACEFEYRDSVFKKSLKNQYIILYVTFNLDKHNHHLVTNYGNIEAEMKKNDGKTISDVRNAVINIRKSKLPEPSELGNAGSFFKNPIVKTEFAENIRNNYPDIPIYKVNDDNVKISAGWLIENCGWKQKHLKNVGVYEKHALIIVNYGNASGTEIFNFSNEIKESVNKKYGIDLEREVIVY